MNNEKAWVDLEESRIYLYFVTGDIIQICFDYRVYDTSVVACLTANDENKSVVEHLLSVALPANLRIDLK